MLMDYELGPRSLALQNHMGNLRVFEDSHLFYHWLPEREFSCMDHKNGPDLSTPCDRVSSTPGRSRVENLVAWECPGDRLGGMAVQTPYDTNLVRHKVPKKMGTRRRF